MTRRAVRDAVSSDVAPMGRGRLLAVLGVGFLVSGCLLFGLGYSLVRAATESRPSPAASGPDQAPVSLRDQIAAAPMLAVGSDAGFRSGVAISLPPAVTLPAATGTGAGGVPSGFPRTPEGAAAQLAALEVHVLTAMSIPDAMKAYRAWALPGGVGAEGWSQTRNVQSFLTGAQQQAKDAATILHVTPAAFQIKGVDGPDWVLACVLLEVRATIRDAAAMGYGTCERLQWTGDRWLIAPGTPPADAPSTWPGSELSVRAGWRPIAVS